MILNYPPTWPSGRLIPIVLPVAFAPCRIDNVYLISVDYAGCIHSPDTPTDFALFLIQGPFYNYLTDGAYIWSYDLYAKRLVTPQHCMVQKDIVRTAIEKFCNGVT
jgi:hypothetical protein